MSVDTLTRGARGARDAFAGYAEPEERPPFRTYAALAATFNAAFAGALLAAGRSGRLPDRVSAQDVVLIGTASHKLSRVIAKDKVTSFARAPFTEYQGRGGPAEVEERARGEGVRRAVGELLTCPYCLGLWASGAFHAGLMFAPRVTRFAASTLTALTLSDFLQIAYKAAEDRGLGAS
ncbi:MAG: DUF1360 domain-containing protein [Solirubrobacteraceae bacterium]